MAVEKPILKMSYPAAADLSNATNQFAFVEVSGTSVNVCSAATDIPLGVLLNRPQSGQTAEVLVSGICKLRASADLAVGDFVGPAAGGMAVALVAGTDTTKYICGRVIDVENADNDGGYVTAYIDCLAPHRAA